MSFFGNIYNFFGNQYTYLVMGFVSGFIIATLIGSLYGINEFVSVILGIIVGIMTSIMLILFHMSLTDLAKWKDAPTFLSIFGSFLFLTIIFIIIPLLLANVRRSMRYIGDVVDVQEQSNINAFRRLLPEEIKAKLCQN